MIKKSFFIIAGVVLWGIPAGVIFSILAACIEPGTWDQLQKFQIELFLKRLWILVPPFAILGVFVGLFLEYKSRNVSK